MYRFVGAQTSWNQTFDAMKKSSRSRFFTGVQIAIPHAAVCASLQRCHAVSTADTAACGVPYERRHFRYDELGELRLLRGPGLSSRGAFRGLHAGAAALRAFEFALLVIDVSFEFFHGDFAAFAGHHEVSSRSS
jgi:hypothetical protein